MSPRWIGLPAMWLQRALTLPDFSATLKLLLASTLHFAIKQQVLRDGKKDNFSNNKISGNPPCNPLFLKVF
jgi:hypothetical protein